MITAKVAQNGEVTFDGHLDKNSKNPIVKLNLRIIRMVILMKMRDGLKMF